MPARLPTDPSGVKGMVKGGDAPREGARGGLPGECGSGLPGERSAGRLGERERRGLAGAVGDGMQYTSSLPEHRRHNIYTLLHNLAIHASIVGQGVITSR